MMGKGNQYIATTPKETQENTVNCSKFTNKDFKVSPIHNISNATWNSDGKKESHQNYNIILISRKRTFAKIKRDFS